MQDRSGHFHGWLVGIALVGLGVRVVAVVAWQQHFPVAGDQVFYHHQANALADGYGYVNPYAVRAVGWLVPSAAHPPGYSTYLAVGSLLGLRSPLAHQLWSCLLGVALIAIVAMTVRRIAGDRAGLLAAAAVALYPPLWTNDGALASESLYAVAVALVLAAAWRAESERTTWAAALLGIAIAAAVLVRAEATALYPFVALPILAASGAPWRLRLRQLAVAALCGAAVLAPWVVRNLRSFDRPVFVSVGAGYVAEIANCDETYEGEFLGYWSWSCDRTVWPEGDESVVEHAKREVALDYVRTHASRAPLVVAARVGRMWEVYRPLQGVRLNDFFERRGLLPSRIGLGAYYLLLPASAAGLVTLRRRGAHISPYVGVMAATTLAAALSFGITRYRTGADVALCMLAGIGIDALGRAGWVRSRTPRAVDVDESAVPT